MQKNFKLGIIGAGFMSRAILGGILNSKKLKKDDILVSDIKKENLLPISEMGVATTTDNKSLANLCEFVLLAVKPQNFIAVANDIAQCKCDKFISIMAGVTISKIKSQLKDCFVARCMPNAPCSLGCGAIGIDAFDFKQEDVLFINEIFKTCGEVVFVKENKLNAVTAISGSAPAYFYYFVRSLVKSGVDAGLTEKEAKMLATATMIGGGKMIKDCPGKSLDDLILAVCSEGGTTIEAIKVFEQEKLEKTIKNAVNACILRAEELEKL